MTRRSLVLLLLSFLLSISALAQPGDLSVRFTSESRIAEPGFYEFHVNVSWTGEETARDVVLEMNVPGTIVAIYPNGVRMNCTDKNPVRCTMPLLLNTQSFSGAAVSVRFPGPGTYVATATVSTSTPEGPVENNSATHAVTVAGLPDMWGSLISEDTTVDPNGTGSVRLGIMNKGAPATNIVVRARLEEGAIVSAVPAYGVFGEPTATCTLANGEATCLIPYMDRQDFELVRLKYRAPVRRDGGKVVILGSVEPEQEDFAPLDNTFGTDVLLRRSFVVFSAADAGSGTLRQAIDDANAGCSAVPCSIVFDGTTAIQPRTPLPAVRGTVRIDGGDARVALDGSLLTAGDGLHYDGGCAFEVRNLVIRNFPGHGIEAQNGVDFGALCNFIDRGLFVRKTELANNERGIVVKKIDASLRENVIHDHRRAGIFIDGSWYAQIFNNVVVNNGATGIYVNTSAQPQFGGIPPGADIVENIVHGNGEWGIARTRNGLVQMQRNSTIRNGLYGFDVGLDLNTPNRENDGPGVPNKPLLESATYDPVTDTTTIRGTAPWGSTVDLYASTSLSRYGYPEAESWLGILPVLQNQKIEWTVPGDLRGQWITGTITRGQTLYFLRDDAKPAANVGRPSSGYDTSELSDPVQVQ
jgi:parallel beta-helix repeat protein